MKNEYVLILGAGPAGMAAALELYKARRPITIIEKNERVGGLGKTLKLGEFRTDIGPHRFFSQNSYLYKLIEDLIGERWIKVNRLTRFYIKGKFLLYPIEIKDVLLKVGPFKASRILFDYLYERAKDKFIKKNPISFEDYIVSEFGRSLAELNILNYTEKIWGLPCSGISPDWAKQRIKGLSLISIIKKAFMGFKEGPKTLIDQFCYPDTGTGLIFETIKERISGESTEFKTSSYPCKIIHKDDEIVEVVVNSNGEELTYKPKHLISSMPITEFIGLLEPKPKEEILHATESLRFRSHVSLFMTLNKSSVFPDQWIYFPDEEIPFGRIMEPKNFSKKMSPDNKTSLLVEFFCWENDDIWNMSKEDLYRLSIDWLERLGFVKKDEVIDYSSHKERYAYPVYDLEYKVHLEKIKDFLNFKNLQCIGRAGRFRYNNLDHALEIGILAARSIIEGKKYNIDEVGAEQAYFERGYIS